MTLPLLCLFVGAGLLITALAIPMWLRLIGPNPWYGFRTPKTRSDERIWYEANAYAGRLLALTGLIVVATAVFFYFVLPPNPATYSITCTTIFLATLAGQLILSFRHLRSL